MFDPTTRLNHTITEIKPSGIRKFFDLLEDMPLLQRAQNDAAALLGADPDLATHPLLAQAVDRLFAQVGEEGLN